MKKIHIVALVMMAGAVGMLVMSSQELSSFSTFDQARASGKRVKVSGQLSKKDPIVYKPEIDANFFSFYLKDDTGEIQQVTILKKKPQDFERSESIVITGKWVEDHFLATEMLLKCPSKYKNEELELRNRLVVSSEEGR